MAVLSRREPSSTATIGNAANLLLDGTPCPYAKDEVARRECSGRFAMKVAWSMIMILSVRGASRLLVRGTPPARRGLPSGAPLGRRGARTRRHGFPRAERLLRAAPTPSTPPFQHALPRASPVPRVASR